MCRWLAHNHMGQSQERRIRRTQRRARELQLTCTVTSKGVRKFLATNKMREEVAYRTWINAVLLPINAIRLRAMIKLIRDVDAAARAT